jgi:sRNA-binding protein
MGGHDSAIRRKKAKKVADAVAALRILIEQFPDCFGCNDHRPLKIGIHKDLMARGVDRRAVRLGLSRYCGHIGYHNALVEGATRIDLDGQPAGIVTAQEAGFAAKNYAAMLEAAVRKQKARCEQAAQGHKAAAEARQRPTVIEPAAAGPPVAPSGRLGLAELRAAGRQRREQGPQRRVDN